MASNWGRSVPYPRCDRKPRPERGNSFRRQNGKLIAKFFVRVLELAQQLKPLQVGTISVDGTRRRESPARYTAPMLVAMA